MVTAFPVATASLFGAVLTGAKLQGTNLSKTDLRGANLDAANLDGAILTGALYDTSTHWPAGFDPSLHGAIRSDAPKAGAN